MRVLHNKREALQSKHLPVKWSSSGAPKIYACARRSDGQACTQGQHIGRRARRLVPRRVTRSIRVCVLDECLEPLLYLGREARLGGTRRSGSSKDDR